jgi:epsilon-lactone hydrolase
MPSWQSRIFRLYLNYLKATTNWNAPIEKLRQASDEGARLSSLPQSIQSQPTAIEHMPAEWLIPPQANALSAILYLHGGGFATGSIKSHRALVGRIAEAGNIRALLIEYRLAPEHPFPAALQDALLAYDWLQKNGYEKIVLVADSAGGGLALSTITSLRDRQSPMPLLVICMSPLIDVEGTGESVIANARRDPWLKEEAKSIFKYYIGQNNPRDPLISPLYADYTNFPPLLIFVGGDEIMLSDSTRLAEKARSAGVDVQIKIWEGMWHVFPFFAPFVPESLQAITEIGDFIKRKVN